MTPPPSFRKPSVARADAARYDAGMKKIPLPDLRPTQFSLGMREVGRKTAKLLAMGKRELHHYLHERPVLVVLSPRRHWRIVDHHHHVRACWEALPISVKADLSRLSHEAFWDRMRAEKWTHLHDQFGLGPHEPHLLPESVRGMADDPYRSLAWSLRHAGAYEKTDEPFAEFKWADFLRPRVFVEHGDAGFARALTQARSLARSPAARALPGFLKRGR
jgi:hypothetical protein